MKADMVSIRFVVFGFCGVLGCSQPAPTPEAQPVLQTIEATEEPLSDTTLEDVLTPGYDDGLTGLESTEPVESKEDSTNTALIEDIQTPTPPKPVKHEGPSCKKTSDCQRYPITKDGSYWKCVDKVCVKGNHFEGDGLW